MDSNQMAEIITSHLEDGPVAVEMFREGFWIHRAEARGPMLAIWRENNQGSRPDFLLPDTAPFLLRLASPR